MITLFAKQGKNSGHDSNQYCPAPEYQPGLPDSWLEQSVFAETDLLAH
jgi:hypothetical protein